MDTTNKIIGMKKKEASTIEPPDWVDVRSGRCSYGAMVTLGQILDNEIDGVADSVKLTKSLIRTLHPDAEPEINVTNVRYATEIAHAVRFWREQEADKLKYTPSAQEKQAGYEALAKVSGATGVASTIAEKFGVSEGPDAVFRWEYASVFMVLYIDLERHKFQKRLQEIRDKTRKNEERNRRRV